MQYLSKLIVEYFKKKKTKKELLFLCLLFVGIGLFALASAIFKSVRDIIELSVNRVSAFATNSPGAFIALFISLLCIVLAFWALAQFYEAEQDNKEKRDQEENALWRQLNYPDHQKTASEIFRRFAESFKFPNIALTTLEGYQETEKDEGEDVTNEVADENKISEKPFSDEVGNKNTDGIDDSIAYVLEQKFDSEILRVIDELFGDSIRKKSAYQTLKSECDKTRRRLRYEIESLNNRGKLNLSIGIIISVLGIIFLGWSFFFAPQSVANNLELIAYYLPRATFVIMIQFFAFFFLNLYRASLNDIKYFQNELTNVEAKVMSVEVLILADNMGMLAELAKDLSKVERNFLLEKNQTTVVLEKEKLESNIMENTLKLIAEVLGKKEGGDK
jgi:uncharacterized membrane protein YidH (DUF202 family)